MPRKATMFLSLDIGNTQTTYGLIDENAREVVKRWRTQTSPNDTADELAGRLTELFASSDFSLEDVTAVGISCVVPALFHAWQTAVKRLERTSFFIRAVDFLDMGLVGKDIAAPETIGSDRLANAAEARRTYGAPAIVVDFGTATNIDVIDADGAFIGGSISPGLMLSATALFQKAGMLADVPIKMPQHAIGVTSEENLQAGLVLGWAGMIEKLVSCMKAELLQKGNALGGKLRWAGIPMKKEPGREKEPVNAGLLQENESTKKEWQQEGGIERRCAIIGTGGLMSIMSEATDCFTALDSDLTLRGIYDLYQMKNT